MPRDWNELFTGVDDAPVATAEPDAGESSDARGGFFRRLRENMSKTRSALGAEVQATLAAPALDTDSWERIEEALILADVGARTTAEIVGRLEAEVEAETVSGHEAITARLIELLAETARTGVDTIDLSPAPMVLLVCGVNGTGKTTTIGKLAWHLQHSMGRKVVIGAADTFRAAAVEQLERWGERSGAEVIKGAPESDPGAVAYDAVKHAVESGADVAIIDTAGRLHTQDDLMAELGKIRRVIAKQLDGAPHETLITIDATTGQNGLRQAKLFSEVAEVSGVVLTKLDGTAKGGIALAIAGELGIPVKLIGIGEGLEDLRPFDAGDFARALLV
jgi:fused signal recognition particle receptor